MTFKKKENGKAIIVQGKGTIHCEEIKMPPKHIHNQSYDIVQDISNLFFRSRNIEINDKECLNEKSLHFFYLLESLQTDLKHLIRLNKGLIADNLTYTITQSCINSYNDCANYFNKYQKDISSNLKEKFLQLIDNNNFQTLLMG